MSNPVPPQRSPSGAARDGGSPDGEANREGGANSANGAGAVRGLPDVEAVSPIEQAIARSEHASAALAAVAALARASAFSDSQLPFVHPGDPAAETEGDPEDWACTEYASLDQAAAAPGDAFGDAGAGPLQTTGEREAVQAKYARDGLLGAFEPVVPLQAVRAVPGSSISHPRAVKAVVRTRGGTESRFLEDSALTAAADRARTAAAKVERDLAACAVREQRSGPTISPRRTSPSVPVSSGDTGRLLLAAMAGALVVALAGVGAWKSGRLAPAARPAAVAVASPVVVAEAQVVRTESASASQEIVMAPPAAGIPAPKPQADVVAAALAAVARGAPAAKIEPAVRAVDRPRKVAVAASAPVGARIAGSPESDGVAAAVADAQARADRFLGAGAETTGAAPTGAATQEP
jgi:hypothetical protein